MTFFRQSEFFTLCWKQIFENFFSNCSHLKTIWWKFVKPTGNSHKYSKFSYAERSSQKYWTVSDLLKFEVLAPCGRHANEVICPYPLACPCYSLSNHFVIFVLFNVCSSNYHSLEHITVDAATAVSKPKPLSKFFYLYPNTI